MKVLVCGGRDFSHHAFLFTYLDNFHREHRIRVLVHGGARGADSLAGTWAMRHHVDIKRYPAEWDKFGRAAGFIRNQQMLDDEKPDVVIAFPGGHGTRDMVKRAKKAGIKVIFAKEW